MDALKNYLENFGWTAVFDFLIIALLAALVLTLLLRKHNSRLALLLSAYFLIVGGVSFFSAYTNGKYLYIGAVVLRYFSFFVIFSVCLIYQNDIRNTFGKLSRGGEQSSFRTHGDSEDELIDSANEIVKAVQGLSKNDTGALIVMCPDTVPGGIVDTGTRLNCLVSAAVLQSIFNKKSPLHDGAVIIKNNTIIAAGCFLPLTARNDISKDLGTRHRAAIGVTEDCNVFSIVVSEESGIVSIVHRNGDYKRFITSEKLLDEIAQVYGISVLSRLRKPR